jgi:hypothetical protein
MSFDYDDTDTADDVIRSVAASMSDTALKPLTDLEIAERQEWRRDYLARHIAAEQQRLAQEREREAVAQREAAIAAQEAREKAQRQRQQEIERGVQSNTLNRLQLHAVGQERRQRELDTAFRNQALWQARQQTIAEFERLVNPPPPPEPTVVVVEADQDDDTFCGVKVTRPNPRRSWW